MATSIQLPEADATQLKPARISRVLANWHLLSLDAPSVAMLWTWFIASADKVRLPAIPIIAMGTAVWMLYAADRLLDARREGNLEPRHLFHRHHRGAFLCGIGAALITLAILVPQLPQASLRLYTVLGGLLAAYFVLIHLKRGLAPRLPKEIAVGIFFSAAVFIPTVSRHPALRASLLPAAGLFGGLCAINCLFIYLWEHAAPYREAHLLTRLALRHLPDIACIGAAACLALPLLGYLLPGSILIPWQISAAIALAIALLILLNSARRRLDPTTLRAAADLCLLTPLLFAVTLAS